METGQFMRVHFFPTMTKVRKDMSNREQNHERIKPLFGTSTFFPFLVASAKTYSDKKPKPFIGAGNNKELDHALSSETTSGETDTYEDSSSMSLPDSIDGDGQSLIERNGE